MEQLRERYLMLDAALEKLRGEISATETAGKTAELAELRDKEVALTLAIQNVRERIQAMERGSGSKPLEGPAN